MTAQEIIEKIRAEIERLKGKAERQPHATPLDVFEGIGKIKVCNELLSSLSALEKEEKPSEELEEEINRLSKNEYFDFTDWKAIARHFAKWQKGQMMENALHGWLDEDNEPPYDLNVLCEEKIPFGKFKHCDKVKIIIVKED